MSKKIAVIGGGASGLFAAIFAAQNGNSVTIYESGERVGRKMPILKIITAEILNL